MFGLQIDAALPPMIELSLSLGDLVGIERIELSL
jgi:hypothetical protein